ncbi:MAG: ribonuclease J [Candidatus Pacebacteria bacterium]|nr:ribonuclease J [Candidatus Paceibacterota bacterium]MBP9840341.1 ribonuclease J [Candidatus Paceibacterota bacterium]
MAASPAPAPAPAPNSRPASGTDGPARAFDRPRRPQGAGRAGGFRGARGGARGERGNRPGKATRDIRRILRRPGGPSGPRGERTADYNPPRAAENIVRIVPLGGCEEVGRNMYAVETHDDIFVFDAGFQFVQGDTTPGVDYILPNTHYLEQNADRVRAVIVSHGHLDHIGGIPFLLTRFGNPPIYTRNLTAVMIAKRYEEYPDIPKPEIITVDVGQVITIGSSQVEFFGVTHSIPDAMGVSLRTPYGNVVVTGDLKLDHVNGEPSDLEKKNWGVIAAQKNLFFIADSTNAEKDGFSIPEKKVSETLEEIIKTVKGRLIIGTLSSQFDRMIHIIKTAESLGKKIVTEGRSIKNNLEIAQKTGLLIPQKGTFIPTQEVGDYPPDKVVVLATGAQGEEFGALTRIATGQNKHLTFNDRDTIILSSSVIPGNEISVQRLKDNLYRKGVSLIHYRSSDVHSTGHGNTGELIWFNKQINAKFFMPAYGYYSMTHSHAKAVEQAGRPRDSIVVADNGTVIDLIDGERMEIHKQKVPSSPLVVDGFAIGDMQEVVIRDRQMLAKDGMFVVIATVNLKTGKLRKSPDIISRGFVYLRESQDMLNQARLLIKKTVEDTTQGMNPVDLDYVKNTLTDALAGFLFTRTNKAPMVIPVLIGV